MRGRHSHSREILGLHGIPKRHRSQPREGMGHNGARAAKDDERSAEFEWKNRGPKQVCLQSDGQMSTLFCTLRKSFEWTDECQKAFEDLKKSLSSPPLLSPSKPGEELYLYIAVSQAAISAALVREEEGTQRPV